MSEQVRDPLADDKRPDAFDVWKQHHFNVKNLCKRYRLNRMIVLAMLRNQPIVHNEAEKVLRALSNFLGQDYTTTTVRVQVIQERTACP